MFVDNELSERQLLSFQVTCSAKISPAGSSPLNDRFFSYLRAEAL